MRLDNVNFDGTSKAQTTPIRIRMANLSDLDDIVAIVIAAFRQDPQWCYRFPHAAKYMCDHRKYTRLRYLDYFKSVKSGVCTLMVAEMSDKHKPRTRKVVAFSLWQMPGKHGLASATLPAADTSVAATSAPVYSSRRDANKNRIQAFRKAFKSAKKEFFDDTYGENQLYLMNIATLPGYSRRGAGSMLLEWGLKKASIENLTITLSASPAGYKLYRKFGFREVGDVYVKLEGEMESVEQPFMVLEPN